jgi:hypothetical protein
MSIELKDGSTTSDRRLDRLVHFDELSRNFPVRRLISREQPISRKWRTPRIPLDQGREGACVGAGCAHSRATSPMPIRGITMDWAREQIYYPAQRDDPWPGGEYPGADPEYGGTAVLSGIKRLQELGAITTYHWAFSEPELALAVSWVGPVVMGTVWKENMFNTDADGFIDISGPDAGGHCWVLVGYNVPGEYYWGLNSWGPDWGKKGLFKIRKKDMAQLQAEQGEACVITGRRYITI